MKISFVTTSGGMLSELIAKECPHIDPKYIKRQIALREVKVNFVRIAADVEAAAGDNVEAFFPERMTEWSAQEPQLTADTQPLDEAVSTAVSVIYADDNLVIAFKEAGVETVGEFDERVRADYPNAAPIHRLDRNTEGLVIFARGEENKAVLVDSLNQNLIKKFYLAEVKGKVKKKSGILKAYLFKDSKKSLVYISNEFKTGYVPITTAFSVIDYRPHTTLLEVELLTGRTHQIRAHLRHIGYPIAGDGKYGDNKFNREHNFKHQKLRAYKLAFTDMPPPLEYMSGKVYAV